MNNEVTSVIGDVASRAQDKASELGQRASEFGHRAVGAIDGHRGTAANALDSAADTLGASADYVRGNKMADMVSDLGKFVKANPGPALVGALVVGFFAGRMLRRN